MMMHRAFQSTNTMESLDLIFVVGTFLVFRHQYSDEILSSMIGFVHSISGGFLKRVKYNESGGRGFK